ncbi:hypothetical protein I5Q34_27680 [Streptomyces sp. AV19]|uniref:hypothetical protein n=1 Tax=Streptomyces sp. AV19 TaxID=2793068 RepID=UPI0018FE2869|nr:hypothetical protein [Streptomyces sp. AV19]MBH1938007.1 hypothetical protein [Streptomyces sp. AV19]MDG4536622.1 hypothetical protein [Streptomyces sp. AV19]
MPNIAACFRHGCNRPRAVRTAGTFHMFCGAACDAWLSVAHAVSRRPDGEADAKRLLEIEAELTDSAYLSRDHKKALGEMADRHGVVISARSYKRLKKDVSHNYRTPQAS